MESTEGRFQHRPPSESFLAWKAGQERRQAALAKIKMTGCVVAAIAMLLVSLLAIFMAWADSQAKYFPFAID